MAEVASAFVSLMPSARGFGKEAESQVSGEMKKSGSRVGKFFSGALKKTAVGAMAAVGATAGVALFKGFGRLKGIEEAQAKLTGLGHSAKSVDKIMNSALASVKGTAFGLDEAATVAASAVAAGVEPGKALQRTLTLVGDAATIAGTDMGSMGAIFNKVAASNKLQMDSVNQLHDAGIPALQLVAKQLGVTAEEASKMASEGKVDFATFQKAMQKGLGGAAQESGKTFSGSLANMQAALGRLGANVLQGVFGKMPALFTKVGTSLDKLGPLATRAGELLGDGMTRAGKAVAPLAQQLGGSLRRAAAQATAVIKGIDWSPLVRIGESVRRDLIPALISFGKVVAKNVGAALKAVAPPMIALGLVVAEQVVPAIAAIFSKAVEFEGVLVPLAAALGAGVLAFKAYALAVAAVAAVQKIWLGVQVALNVALTANPIGLVVAALAALAVGLVVAYKRSETFRNIVNGVFAKVRAAAQAFASGAKKAFQTVVSALDAMQDGVSRGVSAILGWFRQLPGQILGALGGLGGLLRKAGASVIDGFLGGMKKAWGGLVSWVGGLGTRIRGVIGDLGRLLYDIGVGIMDGLLSGIKAGWGKVSSFAGSVAGEVKGIFKGDFKINSPAKLIIPIGMSVIEGLQVGMVTQAKKLTKTTSSITKGVKKFFTTDIKKIGPAMVKSMKSMLKSLQQQLNKATKRVDLFKSIRDQVKSAFAPDLFSGSLKDFLSGVGTQLAGNKAVLAAFPKLLKKGLKGDFLTALMGSGNTQLILGLAGADSSALKGLQSDWNEMNSIAGKLGTNVAQTQVGSSLKSLEKKADKLNSLVEKLDKRIGKAVGNELNKGARKGKKAKKK